MLYHDYYFFDLVTKIKLLYESINIFTYVYMTFLDILKMKEPDNYYTIKNENNIF